MNNQNEEPARPSAERVDSSGSKPGDVEKDLEADSKAVPTEETSASDPNIVTWDGDDDPEVRSHSSFLSACSLIDFG